MLVSDGNALADRLLRALPGHEPDVYLALASAFHSAVLARRFLERFPNHPRAAEAWSQLDGDRMGGAFDLRFPESARWLAPFIDRGSDYPHRDVATALLMRELAGNPNRGAGLNAVDRRTRLVSTLFPASRIRQVAGAARVSALLDADRPEAALQGVGDVLASLPEEDPVHAMALELQERARAGIAAKHVRQ